MSVKIKKELATPHLLNQLKFNISRDGNIIGKTEAYVERNIDNEDFVFIPHNFAYSHFNEFLNDNNKYEKVNNKIKNFTFREGQRDLLDKMKNIMDLTRSTLLKASTGTGKTKLSVILHCELGVKTVVLTYSIDILSQWKKEFETTTDAKVIFVREENDLDKDYDVYLISVQSCKKFGYEKLAKIGFLIVDEADRICSEKYSRQFFSFTPKYCLALTATPQRADNMIEILNLCFGENYIENIMEKKYIVIRVDTGVTINPLPQRKWGGKVDWTKVEKKLSESTERNILIWQITKILNTIKMIILCNKKEMCRKLKFMITTNDEEKAKEISEENFELKETIQKFSDWESESFMEEHKRVKTEFKKNENKTSKLNLDFAECLLENMRKYHNTRVLIGIDKKMGVGFDEANYCENFDGIKSQAIILTFSTKRSYNLIQYLGRIRDKNVLIFDLRDGDNISRSHYKERLKTYNHLGAYVFEMTADEIEEIYLSGVNQS